MIGTVHRIPSLWASFDAATLSQGRRFLNKTLAVSSGTSVCLNQVDFGMMPSFSNLTSYVVTMCASISFNSCTAKKRPGL